jgi:hypothetical protein
VTLNWDTIDAQLPPLVAGLIGLPTDWAKQPRSMHVTERAQLDVIAGRVLGVDDRLYADTAAADADTDAIIASGVTSTTGVQNVAGGALNGVLGAGVVLPTRILTITLSAHADWDATTIVVSGKDASGFDQMENFIVPNGGGVVLSGTKRFKQITNVMIPAQSGPGGTLLMGVGATANVTESAVGQRELTLQVSVWSPLQSLGRSARRHLERLRTRLRWQSSIGALAALGLAIVTIESIVLLDPSEDGRVVSGAAMDLRLAYSWTETDDAVPFIETVQVRSEYLRDETGAQLPAAEQIDEVFP